MLGYKAVSRIHGKLVSTSSVVMVLYLVDEWVHKPDLCGPLCLFSELRYAQNFIYQMGDFVEIWEAEYVPSNEKSPHAYGQKFTPLPNVPDGTVLADAVRLIRKC